MTREFQFKKGNGKGMIDATNNFITSVRISGWVGTTLG